MVGYKLFFCVTLQIGICLSSVGNRFSNHNDEIQNNSLNFHDSDQEPLHDDLTTGIRMEDYCTFTKLEKPIDPTPDPEDCVRINEQFKVNENYNFINYFGKSFELLKKGAESFSIPKHLFKMNTILFIGNTGAGKSTLVQILGGDNLNLYSKPVTGDKTEFIIVDNSKIGENTIVSKTLYPELIVDRETGYVLCDNPGFADTRGPVHEIIAMYSMKKVLRRTNKVKIVIVTSHPSVKEGMYREDFPNLLKHSVKFFNNIDKYKNSFYLVANKVENTYYYDENDKYRSVTDENVIKSIGVFLDNVRKSMSNKTHSVNNSISNYKNSYLVDAVKLIDTLTLKEYNTYSRINILRRPAEEGPISSIAMLQTERTEIRNRLLNEDNMVKVDAQDANFTLSDSAVIYLLELFDNMNTYITDLSNLISTYLSHYYEKLIKSKTNIDEIISVLIKMKIEIKNLSADIARSKNPLQYVETVKTFSEQNKLNLDCLTSFQNISSLNEYLTDIDEYSGSFQYSSLQWGASIGKLSDFIDDNLNKYSFLQNLYKYINSYEIQKVRKSYNIVSQKVEDLYAINLASRDFYHGRDATYTAQIREMFQKSVKYRIITRCVQNTLTITGNNVLLSELTYDTMNGCDDEPANVVILAMHTIYIDTDLPWLRGKYVTIIAPIWVAIGSRTINVDGVGGGEALPKASFGEIGIDGESGGPGGKFYGIGKTFINGDNLMISASGGNGQDGQEGGDGVDGREGQIGDETSKKLVDEAGISYSGFGFKKNTYVASGSSGETGGNAGEGGKGGDGGKKGSVFIYNVGYENHGITVTTGPGKPGNNGKDGKPGKGGVKGCDTVITKNSISAFGFDINLNSNKDSTNCGKRNNDGQVRKSTKPKYQKKEQVNAYDSPVCVHIMRFQNYYLNQLHSSLTDGVTATFISEMKSTKY